MESFFVGATERKELESFFVGCNGSERAERFCSEMIFSINGKFGSEWFHKAI